MVPRSDCRQRSLAAARKERKMERSDVKSVFSGACTSKKHLDPRHWARNPGVSRPVSPELVEYLGGIGCPLDSVSALSTR